MSFVFTATGSKFYISNVAVTSEPADAAAYAALTWVEITGIQTLGQYGDQANVINFAVIGDSRVRKSKGARDAGTMQVTTAHYGDDTGQLALIAAEATNKNYAFKVDLPNSITPSTGTDELNYFIGLVSGKKENIGTNDNIVARTFDVVINSKITVVAAT